jgi:signal transduction histidine kinase
LQIAHEQLALRNLQKQQQERFMAMLTHELKTPMAVIHMALGKLQLSDPVQRRVRLALTDMTAIVEDCQQVDQLEQQQLIAKSEPCNLAQILDEIKDRNDDAPQRLQIDAQGLPTITTDPQLLRIVLGNLIDNAFKYADSDSPIAIHAQASTQGDVPGVRVSVHNQVGLAGLPDADKVFEKYYRSPGAHRKTGSGLGLYLVKSYMQLLGGQVTYSVAETQVEFTLWIPC